MTTVAGWAPGTYTFGPNGPSEQPLPPVNVQVVSPFIPGTLDIRWDDPAILGGNTYWTVVGVNVYRSDVSDRGPFYRINDIPLGGTFYRDRVDNVQVAREVVQWTSAWISKGNASNDARWVFRTLYRPIVKKKSVGPYETPTSANAPSDVTLWIDGEEVPVSDVFGPTGEITLVGVGDINEATEQFVPAKIPNADSTVEVTYWTSKNHVQSGLDRNVFYRLATVVLDPNAPSGYQETQLPYCPPHSVAQVETIDYIWLEAVRRNQWILQQGGERVKVFIRRTSGVPCYHGQDPRQVDYSKNPSNRCVICFGTGFIGGYDGPYDIIIAPDDYERRISQGVNGRRKEHSGEVWTGPSPLLTQRDFVVKQTNERYSVGPVRRPSNRGEVLQQHFSIGYFDEQDIRYSVPIDGTTQFAWPETRFQVQVPAPRPVDGGLDGPTPADAGLPLHPDYPTEHGKQLPMETNDPNIPPQTQPRGRTPAWENIHNG